MSKRAKFGTRLTVEALEQRQMMRANVTAVVVGGSLIIRGDVTGHAIAITASSDASKQYDIIGFDNATTVNNKPIIGGLSTASVSGVTAGVVINLPGGNNTVLIGQEGTFWTSPITAPVAIPGRLAITTGSGADQIGLDSVTVGKGIAISTGAGDDRIGTNDVTVTTGQTVLTTGAGNDKVAMLGFAGAGANIATGADNDSVFIRDMVLTGQLAVSLSSGDDLLLISDDLSTANFGPNFDIPTSGPVDLGIGTTGAAASSLLADTNSGTNNVTLQDLALRNLVVTTGPDVNTLSLTGVQVSQSTTLLGGPGTNTWTQGAGNSLGTLRKLRFLP
jgi:hypothetical protein